MGEDPDWYDGRLGVDIWVTTLGEGYPVFHWRNRADVQDWFVKRKRRRDGDGFDPYAFTLVLGVDDVDAFQVALMAFDPGWVSIDETIPHDRKFVDSARRELAAGHRLLLKVD